MAPLDPALAARVARLDENQREWFDERCALREYDGGLSRADAEQAAWGDLLRHFGDAIPAQLRQPDRT